MMTHFTDTLNGNNFASTKSKFGDNEPAVFTDQICFQNIATFDLLCVRWIRVHNEFIEYTADIILTFNTNEPPKFVLDY